jgi:hypothetical protein
MQLCVRRARGSRIARLAGAQTYHDQPPVTFGYYTVCLFLAAWHAGMSAVIAADLGEAAGQEALLGTSAC